MTTTHESTSLREREDGYTKRRGRRMVNQGSAREQQNPASLGLLTSTVGSTLTPEQERPTNSISSAQRHEDPAPAQAPQQRVSVETCGRVASAAGARRKKSAFRLACYRCRCLMEFDPGSRFVQCYKCFAINAVLPTKGGRRRYDGVEVLGLICPCCLTTNLVSYWARLVRCNICSTLSATPAYAAAAFSSSSTSPSVSTFPHLSFRNTFYSPQSPLLEVHSVGRSRSSYLPNLVSVTRSSTGTSAESFGAASEISSLTMKLHIQQLLRQCVNGKYFNGSRVVIGTDPSYSFELADVWKILFMVPWRHDGNTLPPAVSSVDARIPARSVYPDGHRHRLTCSGIACDRCSCFREVSFQFYQYHCGVATSQAESRIAHTVGGGAATRHESGVPAGFSKSAENAAMPLAPCKERPTNRMRKTSAPCDAPAFTNTMPRATGSVTSENEYTVSTWVFGFVSNSARQGADAEDMKEDGETPASFQVRGVTVQSLEPRRGANRKADAVEEALSCETDVFASASAGGHDTAGDRIHTNARDAGETHHCASTGADPSHSRQGESPFESDEQICCYFRYIEQNEEEGDGHMSNKNAEERGFAYRPHPADVILHSWGPNLATAFQRAGLALFNYMTDIKLVQQKQSRRIAARGSDLKSLLFNFLTELLVLYGEDYFVASDICVVSIDENTFTAVAEAKGERFDSSRHTIGTEVKAITMHEMGIWQKNTNPICVTCGEHGMKERGKDKHVELFIAVDI